MRLGQCDLALKTCPWTRIASQSTEVSIQDPCADFSQTSEGPPKPRTPFPKIRSVARETSKGTSSSTSPLFQQRGKFSVHRRKNQMQDLMDFHIWFWCRGYAAHASNPPTTPLTRRTSSPCNGASLSLPGTGKLRWPSCSFRTSADGAIAPLYQIIPTDIAMPCANRFVVPPVRLFLSCDTVWVKVFCMYSSAVELIMFAHSGIF